MDKMIRIHVLALIVFMSCNDVPSESHDYYEDGTLRSMGKLVDGRKVGRWVDFKNNGDTLQVNYYDSSSDMIMTIDYSEGRRYTASNYLNGVEHGIRLFYYPDGSIRGECVVEEGVKIHYKWYHENGQLRTEFDVINNQPVGKVLEYFPNGRISHTGDYSMNGIFENYDSLGNLILKILLKEGVVADTLFYNPHQ